MQRIVVVGPPGSGKSTLARLIASHLGLELFERDAHGALGSETYKIAVEDLLRGDRWVFDGFPYFVDQLIYESSDCVIALRYGRLRVLKQVLGRSWELRTASIGGHPQARLREWAKRDHAVRTAFTRYKARIREIDRLGSRSEIAGKPLIVLRRPAESQNLAERLS